MRILHTIQAFQPSSQKVPRLQTGAGGFLIKTERKERHLFSLRHETRRCSEECVPEKIAE
jgi:hypothetical protein